jgi:16S rRNA pseudouridine516 synthase
MKMRIDKFVSSQRTDLSRGDVKKLIRSGRVSVDGQAARSGEMHIDAEVSEVRVNGELINYKEFVYIMLNKPSGYVCATRSGIFPAGRLDKDTEGFVLITDDGALAHNMLSPAHHVPKTYFVRLREPYSPDYEPRFAAGLEIDGGEVCLPAEVFACDDEPYCCRVILHEGKFHQVKRMFAAVGNEVVYLRREKIGNLALAENLPLGECLEIMHKDVEKLLCR